MVGLNLQFRRQTIYLLFQMIFALACGFSNSFSLPKKKERAELGFATRNYINNPKQEPKNPLKYSAFFCKIVTGALPLPV
jgi:hypothetical protein